MVKNLFIGTGIIALCFMVLLSWSTLQPTEKTTQEISGNYTMKGEFGYQGYTISSLAQPSPILFPLIVEKLDILFDYSDSEYKLFAMKVILEDNNGMWQKEFPVQVSGDTEVSFPLDVNDLLTMGSTISEELGLRNSSYLLKIVADVGPVNNPFEVVLEGQLNSNTLIWNEAQFSKIERGYPGANNLVYGSFGYIAKLKNNSLYGPITIEIKPIIPEFQPTPVGSALFIDTVESMDVDFNFTFSSDIAVNSLTNDFKVDMVLSEQGRWSRTFTLVEQSGTPGAFSISIPLDIDKLTEMIGKINQEIGGWAASAQDITFMVQVHSVASTAAGIINETFTQQLKGTIRDKISWENANTGQENLVLTKTANITKPVTVSAVGIKFLRIFSTFGVGLAWGLFFVLGYMYFSKKKSVLALMAEQRKITKKYKDLISEVSTLPKMGDGETMVQVYSMQDLVNISNNSLKPILLKVEANRLAYLVIDSMKWYFYSVTQDSRVDRLPTTIVGKQKLVAALKKMNPWQLFAKARM